MYHIKNMGELENIRKLVSEDGHTIKWTGSNSDGNFMVRLLSPEGKDVDIECDPMSWVPDTEIAGRLGFVESDKNVPQKVSISPPDTTEYLNSRRAAAFGVNIGGDCRSGACKSYVQEEMCTVSYDIETSMEGLGPDEFPLCDADILSIAAKCSCGSEFYSYSTFSRRSPKLVSEFILYIYEHSPQWTIGWNCYSFDNECMRYHCHKSIKNLFAVTRVGAFGKPSYGSILNIPGSYNIDLLVFMNKAQYKLPSFKLGDAAKHLKVTEKTKMPDLRGAVDQQALRLYNMNDCVVTLAIWKKEKLEQVIPSLALCMASPVYDCARYVTGTTAPLGYSSYAMGSGFLIRWGECSMPQLYSGGYVMSPIKGLHRNIVVCDFSSMYPTIMASCNINPHDFLVKYCNHGIEPGSVNICTTTTTVFLEDRLVLFDNKKPSLMSSFMGFLMAERRKVKKTKPMYAGSLKIFANSLYGSLGYDKSSLYSPSCAAAITAIGRHCVKKARDCFVARGMTVLYGDTDSDMVTGPGTKDDVMRAATLALDDLHAHFSGTSLHMMSMEMEEYYKKGIMMDKKRYSMLREDGTIKNVGISLARRDVSGICKAAAEVAIDAIFKDDEQQTIDIISKFVMAVSQMAVERSLTLSDVAKYTKSDGQSGYEYPHANGKPDFIPEDNAVLSSVVQYDTGKVMQSVSSEIERFTVPCKLGLVSHVLKRSSIDSW